MPLLPGRSYAGPISGSLYSYPLTGVTATPVANHAAVNSGVPLNLVGNWTPSSVGVHFAGDLVSQHSVAYAKPGSGPTLQAAASDAVGGAIKFRYEKPISGSCWKDTHNLSQIGRFGAGLTQLKLQLSSCAGDKTAIFVECRIAGANSTTADVPGGRRHLPRCAIPASFDARKARIQRAARQR